MQYFVDENGLIAWINEQGQSNLPVIASGEANAKVADGKVCLTTQDGEIRAEYALWGNLTALAVAISGPVDEPGDMPMHIDIAVAIAHERIEQYRDDWHKGNREEVKLKGEAVEYFPLELPADNKGVFFEQIAQYIMNDIPDAS